MDRRMSQRQAFMIALTLGFLSGFAWVAATQPLMRPDSSSYTTAD